MPAPTEAPLVLIINRVKRTRRTIDISYHKGTEGLSLDSPDNPLPAFAKAIDDLGPVLTRIIHVGAEYLNGLRVTGLIMGEQGGALTASITAQKSFDDAGKALNIVTPPRLLEHPKEQGSYTPPLAAADVALIHEAVEQARTYVLGDRAQGQIKFEGGSDAEEEGGGETPEEQSSTPSFDEAAAALKAKKPRKKKGVIG